MTLRLMQMKMILKNRKKFKQALIAQYKLQTEIFDERAKFFADVKAFVKQNGFEKLSLNILKALPRDFKVFNEKPWRRQPRIYFMLFKIAWIYAYKEGLKNERAV